jgi:uncharacterized protein
MKMTNRIRCHPEPPDEGFLSKREKSRPEGSRRICRCLSFFRKLAAFLILVFPLLVAERSAFGVEPKDLPKPTDYVSDLAHVLSPNGIKEIDQVCSKLDHSEADTQVAVVTIASLHGGDVAEYARDLANTWGVGRKGRGILILLSINDRKWRIAIGRGLETAVPDSRALLIGEEMIPLLRANNFDGAVSLAVNRIAQAISQK